MLHGHERSITQIKYNREGDLIYSCAKDAQPNVWYSLNGERLGTFNGHNGAVWCIDVDCILSVVTTYRAEFWIRVIALLVMSVCCVTQSLCLFVAVVPKVPTIRALYTSQHPCVSSPFNDSSCKAVLTSSSIIYSEWGHAMIYLQNGRRKIFLKNTVVEPGQERTRMFPLQHSGVWCPCWQPDDSV